MIKVDVIRFYAFYLIGAVTIMDGFDLICPSQRTIYFLMINYFWDRGRTEYTNEKFDNVFACSRSVSINFCLDGQQLISFNYKQDQF